MKCLTQIFAVAFCFLLTVPAFAEFGLDGKTIASITSDDLDPSEVTTLTADLGLTVGKLLDMDRLDTDIKQMGGSGKWMRVLVEGTVEGNHVRLHLRGTRVRRLRKLEFSQVDPEILEEVRRKVRQDTEQTADVESFADLRQALRDAYQDRGYSFADIQFGINKIGADEADVDVRVVQNSPTRVKKITLRGAPEADYAELLDLIPLRPGDIFSRIKLSSGIEKINSYLRANQYTTSRVVDTSLQPSSDGLLVDIAVVLKMGERFQIRFDGNRVVDDVQLRGLLTDEVLAQTDPSGRISQLIESKYRALGYPDVSVQIKKTLVDQGKLNLIEMIIHEGERVTISALRFSNTDQVVGINLEDLFLEVAPGVLKRRLYWAEGIPEAIKNMQAVLLAKGYLNSRIAEPKVTFRDDRKAVVLFFDVDIGVQTFLQKVEFSGTGHFTYQELEGQFLFKVGQPLNKEQVGATAKQILKFYADSGYPQVKLVQPVESALEISHDGQSAVVSFEIEEGPRFQIGTITVEGLKKTKPKIVMQEMEVKNGDLYSAKKIRQSEENINLVGLFKRVEVIETPNPAVPNVMDLRVVLSESRPGAGEMGLGGFYEEPRLRIRSFAGVAYRNVSGLNQTLSTRGEFSVPFSRIGGTFTIPFLEYALMAGYRYPHALGLPMTFATQLSFDRVEVSPDVETILTRARVEMRLEKKLTRRITGIYRLLRVEHTTTQNLSPETAPYTERIGSTGPGLILDLRDDIFNPMHGSYHALDVEFASPVLISQPTISFILAIARNSVYLPIIPGVMKLSLSLGLGYAHSLASLPGGPASIARARLVNELALGGQGSIRGILPRSLVTQSLPTASDQPGTFDEFYYNGRAEITTRIFGDFGIAIFIDTGQIFPNFKTMAPETGVGLGIRYKTPVGPVVVDFAQAFGPLAGPVLFYFTVGSI